jgi:hypothetical protein
MHGISPDALVDPMIWGGINSVEPPYTIKITGTTALPKDVKAEIDIAKKILADGRSYYQKARGGDVEVAIEIAPWPSKTL